jgi:hypothetical protein
VEVVVEVGWTLDWVGTGALDSIESVSSCAGVGIVV